MRSLVWSLWTSTTSYFPTIKEKEVTLLFPDLLRELVAKYLGKNGANWDKIETLLQHHDRK